MVSIKEITFEYLEGIRYEKYFERDLTINLTVRDIYALLGPRRVGKTFLLLKTAENLLRENKSIAYISFDDPYFKKMNVRDLATRIKKEYFSKKVYLFLDEIQEWRNWDRNLRWLHDIKDFQLIISGSSSVLLSSEIPSRLRGRYISKILLPLSFHEIVSGEVKTFREKGKILKLLEDYMKYGGFPEVHSTKSREKIISILDTIFYRDVVERYNIRERGIFEDIFYYVISNYSNTFTYNSIVKMLKEKNINVDVKTVIKYLNAIKDSFLIWTISKFSYSYKKQIISPQKIYLVDTSFAMLFPDPLDFSRKLENIVFLDLLQEIINTPFNKVYYYKTKNNKEIDFLIVEKNTPRMLVESSYEIDSQHINKVVRALDELNLNEGFIVTWEDEEIIEEKGKRIFVVPLWKWLLRKRIQLF